MPGINGLQTLLNSGVLSGKAGVQSMTKLSDYVKTAEAAEILGVSQNTLRAWAKAGAIPVHRNPANGYRLFKRIDLDKFLRTVERPMKRKA
jgi:excisionase family DNA binding protein